MIVDRIYDYLATSGKEISSHMLDVAATAYRRSLVRNIGAAEVRRARMPSPSSSWACQRRRLYDAHGDSQRGDINPRSKIAFLLGDTMEATTILLARLAGVPLLSPTETGEQLTLSAVVEGYTLTGHMDGTVDVGGGRHAPFDCKAVASYTFDKLEAAATSRSAPYWDEARDDYIAQVRLYLYLLRVNGLGEHKEGWIVAVNKNTGHLCEMSIPWDAGEEARLLREFVTTHRQMESLAGNGLEAIQTIPRPSWSGTITRVAQRPDGSKGPVEEVDTVYDRERHGKSFQGWRCGYCPYIEACYPGFEKVLMSKPVWRKAIAASPARRS